MSTTTYFSIKPGAIALVTLMIVSRFDQFGALLGLPDASLAVFFLAGCCFRSRTFLSLLFIVAGLIDYVAINQLGVDEYSISPAYAFLIPTYASLWLAGRHCSNEDTQTVISHLNATGWLITATSFAFFISNTSFFLFSGNVIDLSWAHYIDTWNRYFPHYLGTTLFYAAAFLTVLSISRVMSPFEPVEIEIRRDNRQSYD